MRIQKKQTIKHLTKRIKICNERLQNLTIDEKLKSIA